MLFLFAVTAAIPLYFHFDAAEFANAAYRAACITGRITCGRNITCGSEMRNIARHLASDGISTQ
jgi:hypothetical protein